MDIYKIYDNGGKTADRYTILVSPTECLGVSDDPTHPQYGFSQWSECVDGDHLGTEIEFDDLPENVQIHVTERLKDE